MKKALFISLACVAAHFIGNAQSVRFGFTAGATLANYKIKSEGASVSEKSKTGITTGILADILISNQFSFQPAINFVQKGTKSENTNGPVTEKSSTSVNYIEMPLNFLFNVNQGKSGGTFFIGAGPSIAFAVSGKTKFDDGTNSVSEKLKFGNGTDDDMKRMDLGANFITGYRFKNGLLISVNYNAGLSNLIPGESGGYSAKSNYFGIKLGYLLNGAGKN